MDWTPPAPHERASLRPDLVRGEPPAADALQPDALAHFVQDSGFAARGAVITDLDGTAVLERDGRVVIPKTVSHALRRLHERGRPIAINSLRFPLNVIRTFGREWYSITEAPLPLVSLNGAQVGCLVESASGEIAFEEIAAWPLEALQIDSLLDDVEHLVDAGVDDLVLFQYPRDWRRGEIVWTPTAEAVPALAERYQSASEIAASPPSAVRERLHAADVCMLMLLVNASRDRLMAYQHAQPNRFYTAAGVDKRHGALAVAEAIGFDVEHSVGAGDTPMDTFLDAVGLAVHVGPMDLAFRGRRQTMRVPDSLALGELLFRLADLQPGAARA